MTAERGRGVLRQGVTALGGLVIISICKFVAMWMIARFSPSNIHVAVCGVSGGGASLRTRPSRRV
jgi:hypothetical protein